MGGIQRRDGRERVGPTYNCVVRGRILIAKKVEIVESFFLSMSQWVGKQHSLPLEKSPSLLDTPE